MSTCNITTDSLKEVIDTWWTQWNLHPVDDMPEYVSEILTQLSLIGDTFNLSTGDWGKEDIFDPDDSWDDLDEDEYLDDIMN